MKNLLILSCFVGSSILISCGNDDVMTIIDPETQFEIDVNLINDFVIENGYTKVDTSALGIRYVILDKGEDALADGSNTIDESDQVSYHYTGSRLDGTIFDTTIKSIGDSLRAYYQENPYVVNADTIDFFPESKIYTLNYITYTSSGWSINGFIAGFEDGISSTFGQMNVGGHARIMIPSGLAYGTTTQGLLIPANTVLVFDLYPIKVEKQ